MTSTAIRSAVLRYFAMQLDELLGQGRTVKWVRARHIAWYLEREHNGLSYAAIATDYKRDHSTVVLGYRHVAERVAADDRWYKEPIADITRKLAEARAAENLKAADPNYLATRCPTCGAPVITELVRQVMELRAQVEELQRSRMTDTEAK